MDKGDTTKNKEKAAPAAEVAVQPSESKQVANTAAQLAQHNSSIASNIATKKRFEVEIYDQVTYGEPPMEQIKLEKVNFDQPVIIEASCKKDLQDFAEKLSLCKQTFKIVRVLDDVKPPQAPAAQHAASTTQQMAQPAPQAPLQKPKYYKVGDVELKDDNGKIYQKQWLRLTEAEASNFRIINDKNNSIFNLKDRHIEMKKWVLVNSTDEEIDLEETMK